MADITDLITRPSREQGIFCILDDNTEEMALAEELLLDGKLEKIRSRQVICRTSDALRYNFQYSVYKTKNQ